MPVKAYLGLTAAWFAAAFVTAASAAEPGKGFQASPAAIRAHMSFLASDLLEGREAGTRGYDIAAAYVSARLAELGMKPAGANGTYLQPVPLFAFRPAEQGSMTIKVRGQRDQRLKFGEDFLPTANPLAAETKITAPLVFAGFGTVAPERGRDDYAGLDVRGKIVVVLQGAPKNLQSEERAFYMSRRLKMAEAARRGAIGLITVQSPTFEKIAPFGLGVPRWQAWSMTWRDPAGQPHFPGGGAAPCGAVSLTGAAKLLAGAPVSVEAIMAAAEAPAGDVPRFELDSQATVEFRTRTRTLQSANVAAMIEGSDLQLKHEVVVLSAHLDHLGVSAPVKGDAIYNGAMDNAAGIAAMLEAARGFAEAKTPPRRSVMFLAVTAEEKGLIGAEYFANNPTVPKGGLVANVNLDMPVLTYDFTDVVAYGADRSSIGAAVRRAGAPLGVGLAEDPAPDEGSFVRSDHYRFVEQGVPSVFLATGPGSGGAEASAVFLKQNYHRPSDDLSLPVDYRAGAKFAQLNYAIARELADADARPAWRPGDFFGTRFGGRKLTPAGAQ